MAGKAHTLGVEYSLGEVEHSVAEQDEALKVGAIPAFERLAQGPQELPQLGGKGMWGTHPPLF